jgi:hypothetical protein
MTYPLENLNSSQALDGLNYVLSGPSGLGQDFQGFQSYAPAWLTTNFRTPYSAPGLIRLAEGVSGQSTLTITNGVQGIVVGMTVTGPGIGAAATVTAIADNVLTLSAANTADLYDFYVTFAPAVIPRVYVAPIALGPSAWLDPYTWRHEFLVPETAPPFVPGNNITVSGVTPSDYDGGYTPIGVVECTTDYVIARTRSAFPDPGPGSGGTVELYNTTQYPSEFVLSTDCNLKVTVTGPTDRVFITAQLLNTLSYTATTSSDLLYIVSINRYAGSPNSDPVNPGFFFEFEERITERQYTFTGLTGTGTLSPVETIFSTFVDTGIDAGYYWYILDVSFQKLTGDIEVTESELGLRSMTTQVVKQ